MSLINRKIVAPKHFRTNSIINFINDCQEIYSLPNKKENGFLLDLGKVKECTMIGVLLVYKIIEFSIKNNCFNRPMYLMNVSFRKAMEKYGFTTLILTYLADKDVAEKEFANLKISVSDNFIIAPQALLRNDKYSSELLNKKYLPQIQQYYSFSEKAVTMIFLCFSEILLNFWEHAVDDTQSIIVANGNKLNIEIACVDNGKGILTTLKLAGKEQKNNLSTLLSAVEKGVTSKDLSNHMGYGLWIIDQIASKTKGRFHLYSEGCYYFREFGKVKSGKCGHWQGTIVYLSIPLLKPITLADIETPDSNNNLQIKWI
jgi:hypothetical protein